MSQSIHPAIISPATIVSVLDPDNGPIESQLVTWLEDRFTALRGLMARTAHDLVTIGRMLTEVKAELAQDEFLAFVAALGLSRATAYRWMAAAEVAAGCSHVENLEPSALYALAARSMPEAVREGFLERADAGQHITAQEVQATLRQHRPAAHRSVPNLVERLVDGMVDAEEAEAGQDWRGQDVRADAIHREIMRFEEAGRGDVAATVMAWGHACVAAAQPFFRDGDDW